ncbi:SURP and G-patch domain-containing protein 1-like protein [Melia azedarach]|uniref:SURP and G-patch domain-containing protein 1-like protein n=1 Tax=Melia azedarach TaxID=155640 RepID=A0ACC1XLT3_MELAZ|nr:SURP and G-patch domain-containing protein 1-like protein [Melia azedarach]
MDKGTPSSLFVNDGSFMERFKQLQQDKDKEKERERAATSVEESKPIKIITGTSTPKISINKPMVNTQKTSCASSGGKLAFSLKQKSKLVAPPVKLGADDDEDETEAENGSADVPVKRQKLGQPEASEQSSKQASVAPPPPSDPTVKKVADKLASFVAKNGRQFENVTRQKNPGDTPFKFLFDETCADYKYYEYRLAEEEKSLSETGETPSSSSSGMSNSTSKSTSASQRSLQQQNYQTPASALYETADEPTASSALAGRSGNGESSGPPGSDPIAMMEFYMKKAAHEERKRQPKQSKDEMPPPASLQGTAASQKRGHHMGDYIPQDELVKFLATCNDAAARKAAKEAAEKAKIQADNIGHKLLSKMGWKEGEGLGSSKSGIADPIAAGSVKDNNLGIGAHNPGEVTPEDDIYEQYKKRMMLGYRYRPNPLNNPRKAYY